VYPTCTILIVPKDTPEHVKYIIDADDGTGTGVLPMILQNGSPLNMSITDTFTGAINITRDYPHSFVLLNESNHTIYFAKKAFVQEEAFDPLQDFWSIDPMQMVLFWPSNVYWASISVSQPRFWSAHEVPQNLQNFEHAASCAETMIRVLYLKNAP